MFGSDGAFIELTKSDSTKIMISYNDVITIGSGNNGIGNSEISLISNPSKIVLTGPASTILSRFPNQLHFISCTTQTGLKPIHINWKFITGYSSDGQKGTTVYVHDGTIKVSDQMSKIEEYLKKVGPSNGELPSAYIPIINI
jgi:hypothetical protein